MNVLIIRGGFVGYHLAKRLAKNNRYRIFVIKMKDAGFGGSGFNVYNMNLLNTHEIVSVLNQTQPNVIFNLTAQSSVALSWKKPQLTMDVNVKNCIVRPIDYWKGKSA